MSYAVGLSLPKDRTADPNRSLKIVSFGVVLFHLVLIIFISMQKYEAPIHVKPVQKLVVHTVNLDTGMRVQSSSQKGGRAQEKVSVPEVIPEPEPEIVLPRAIETIAEPEPVEEVEPEPIPEPEAIEEAPPPPAPVPKVVKTTPKPKPAEKKAVPKKTPPKKAVEKPKKPMPKKAPEKPNKPAPKKAPEKPKKAAAKQDAPKKEAPKKETSAAPKIDPQAEALKAKKKALIAQAQASLSKVGKASNGLVGSGSGSSSAKNLAATAVVPSAISSLNADSYGLSSGEPSLTVMEVSYKNELISRLKRVLKLPEHGDVKIKLKLDRSGKVLSFSIVSAQNNANRKHVEKELPNLTFPSFGSNFSGQQDHTFTIILRSDL